MKRILIVSAFAIIAAAASASAAPVTTDDLLKAQDNGEGVAHLRPRLPQLALQPSLRDHSGKCFEALACVGDVDRRAIRRP